MTFPFYNVRDMVKANYRLMTEDAGNPASAGRDRDLVGSRSERAVRGELPRLHGRHLPDCGRGLWGTTQAYFYGVVDDVESSSPARDGTAATTTRTPTQCASNGLSVLIPYFYTREWWDQYVDTPEAYTKWRNNWGDYYLDIQDARDLYYLRIVIRAAAGSATPRASTAT